MLHTNLEFKRKPKSKFDKKTAYKLAGLGVAFVSIFFVGSRLFAASSISWNFDTANDYTVSDSNKIEVTGGNVTLKQVTTTLTDDTEAEFDGGTYLNTDVVDNKLTLSNTPVELPSNTVNLVSQWKFENNWNDSVGSNHGTPYANASFNSNSKFGSGAAVFDGSGDYVVTPTMNIGSTFTVEKWIRINSVKTAIVLHIGATNGYGFQNDVYSDGRLCNYHAAGNTFSAALCTPVSTIQANQWYHIVTTYDGTTTDVYINGVLALTASRPGYSYNWPVYIGGGPASAGDTLNGIIDNVSISNNKWSASTVRNTYLKGIAQYGEYTSPIFDSLATDGVDFQNLSWLPSAPYGKELPNNKTSDTDYASGNINMADNIGLWHFDNNWSDSSGNALTGTPQNDATFSSTSVIAGSHIGTFDGTDDIVALGNSSLLSTPTLTVSSWVKTTSTGGMYVFSKKSRSAGGWHAYTLSVGPMWASSTSGQVSARIQQSAGPTFIDFKTTKAINDGKWHHLALTFDSNRVGKIYIDGILEATSATGSGAIYYYTTGNAYIGGSKYCSTDCAENTQEGSFRGDLDELAIFNRALTIDELNTMYKRGAQRVRYQVRSCNDAACSGESFVGSDGTSNTYFSEINNPTLGTPNLDLTTVPNNQYYQYKVMLETENSTYKPELTNISNTYTSYPTDEPNINLSNQISFASVPLEINSFCEGTLDVNNNCTTTSTKPAGTEIYHQICNDTVANCNANNTWKYWDGSNWVNANSSQFNTASDINSNIANFTATTKHFAFKSFLSSGGANTPILTDLSINAELDEVEPITNASDVFISGVSNDAWIKQKPLIEWTGGSDNLNGIGILGYCVALDESNLNTTQSLNPETSAGILQNLEDGVADSFCPYITTGNSLNLNNINGLTLTPGKQYNFSLKAVDAAGNIWSGESEDYQDLVSFKFDNVAPTNPAFISMPSNFIATKDATITWPTDVTNGASDVGSGLAGLQYKIGQNGTWYGDLHNGNQDLTDLLVNDGSYTTSEEFDYPNLLDGSNVVYVRAIDNAGNLSNSSVTGVLKINSTAPNQVQNLQVTPSDNSVNAYSFSWETPDQFIGEASGLTYCYTINTLPNANNCTYTAAGTTNLPTDAYATQPGSNNFYVVAKDEANNINHDTYSSVQFTYSGEAPGIPLNVDVSDLSVKETEDWKLAVTWATPTNVGAGVSSYKIYRSTTENAACNSDFNAFNEVANVQGTSFIDTGLMQQDYSYCVKACDTANNCSAASTTATNFPTGKYTTPANLISGPTLNAVTTKKAVISWVTDRRSDSKIQIGLSSNDYFEAESAVSAQLTAHTVTLDNLAAGTTYYYRAKWTDEDGNTGISEEKIFTTNPPPSIISTNITNVGINSALLQLRISGATKATILYGIENNFGSIKEIFTSSTESSYTVALEGLSDNSRYTYKIILEDIDGGEYLNLEINEFITLPRPIVSNIQIEEVKNVAQPTVKVNWTSNTETSSIVTYFPEGKEDESRDSINLDLLTTHEMELVGLQSNTRYVLIVKGIDRLGNEAVSSPQMFTTATDTRPPKITNVKVEAINPDSSETTSQIIVSWETDELATSQVEYGEGTNGGYAQSTQIDKNLGYKHVVIITNLKPASVYHLRAISEDNSKNNSETSNIVTITPKQQDTAFDIVLKGLSDIFSFL